MDDNEEILPLNGEEGVSGWNDDDLDGLGEEDDVQVRDTPSPAVVVDHVSTSRVPSVRNSAVDESTVQRENARDDENDLAEGDVGPVVNRIPSSDHLEHADRTVSTQVPSSFVEELDEESKLESAQIAGPDPNALVDHVPVDIPDVKQNISGCLSMNVE